MMLNLIKNKWFWIILVFASLFFYAYTLYNENKELKLEKAKYEQNSAALRDEINKKLDSIQVLTSYVENLNVKTSNLSNENRKLKDEVRVLKAKYEISIDSIKILNQVVQGQVIGDSIGIVPFKGKKNIISYEGQTRINIKNKESRLDYLTLNTDVIKAGAEIFYDESDGLFKMRTISLTEGVILRGISTIDDETFRKLRSSSYAENNNRFFGVGAIVGSSLVAPGFQIRPDRWEFGAHYILFDNLKANSDKMLNNWYDRIMLSVHFFIF